MDFIRRYNGNYGGQRGFYDFMFDSPFLVRQFYREVRETNGRILLQHPYLVCYFVLLMIYLVSPIDLIPELVFGIFGYIDDFAFIVLFLVGIAVTFMKILTNRND